MKVDKETLEDIAKWFKSSDLSSATIEISAKGDFKVTMDKEVSKKDTDYAHYHSASAHGTAPSHAPQFTAVSSAPPSPVSTVASEEPSQANADTKQIFSPIVGTFYRAVSPDTPPFVQEGDKVKKGDTLCIIEAMKVMNEFEAEYDMEIVSVLVENSHLIEYGQALFEVKIL